MENPIPFTEPKNFMYEWSNIIYVYKICIGWFCWYSSIMLSRTFFWFAFFCSYSRRLHLILISTIVLLGHKEPALINVHNHIIDQIENSIEQKFRSGLFAAFCLPIFQHHPIKWNLNIAKTAKPIIEYT